MHQLVYVSSADSRLSEDDIKDVISRARKTNRELGVTGMLVHLDGCFLQVLEGRRERVCDLYARIAADPRHWGAKVLMEMEVPERAFPHWPMGFRRGGRDDLYMAGFRALTRRALDGRITRPEAQILLTIVKTFYRADKATETGAVREPALSLA